MTTSTTDADAIARIIEALISIASDAPKSILRDAVIGEADEFLAFASRREAQKPVAWRWRFVDEKNWTICKTRPKQADDCDVQCEPLYLAPPAPADEVERLRGALKIIAGERQCLDNLMSNADVARAALNGGRPDE